MPDVEADEFNFNFLGHGGTFYYSGPSNGWVVISDEKIKVSVNGFVETTDVLDDLELYPLDPINPSDPPQYFDYDLFDSQVLLGRQFKEFTLTTEDGTKYTFGGLDAVEYSSPWRAVPFQGASISSWLLKKIVDVYGNTVTFNYDVKAVDCVLYTTRNKAAVTYSGNTYSIEDTNFVSDNYLVGSYLFPRHLSSIVSAKERIDFTSANAVALKYTNAQMSAQSG